MNIVERVKLAGAMLRFPKRLRCNVAGVGFLVLQSYSDGHWTFKKTLERQVTSTLTVSWWLKGKRVRMLKLKGTQTLLRKTIVVRTFKLEEMFNG